MSEFITLQVGQCGNQIGSAFWPLVLQEYGILGKNDVKPKGIQKLYQDSLHCFFHNPENKVCNDISDLTNGNVKARALLIDMEESVVQRFQDGIFKNIFDKGCSLTNHPGSGNNWAIGHYTHGNEHKSQLEEMVRSAAEKCDSLHGFLSLFSLGGGTGSGLGTFTLSQIRDEFPKIDRIVTCVHPGINNDVITSPYNISFSLRKMIENATCVIPVDNKALSDISTRMTVSKKLSKIPYGDMNSLIVKMLLSLTSGARFPGTLNVDMNELSVNMVPMPGLHFLSSSLSPLSTDVSHRTSELSREKGLLYDVCDKQNHLLRIDSLRGTLFGATLLVRGAQTSVSTLRNYAERLQERAKFMVWSKNRIKIGHCSVPAHNQQEMLLLLTNTTTMKDVFDETLLNFNRLYNRKAHVHHYLKVDGFEPEEFEETKEALSDVSYKYFLHSKEISIPRLQVF